MRQQTLAEGTFEQYRKVTRRERFLAEMDQVVPWAQLCALIEPLYPKPKGAGRRDTIVAHIQNLIDTRTEEYVIYELQ
jgi:hypothetical protein